MQQHYELCYIIPADKYGDDTVAAISVKVTDLLKEAGATLGTSTDMGKRKFAYPINNIRYGYYYAVEFDAETDVVPGLNDKLRLHEDVLRHLIIKKKVQTEAYKAQLKALHEEMAKSEAERQQTRDDKAAATDKPRNKRSTKKEDSAAPATTSEEMVTALEKPDTKKDTTPEGPVDSQSLEKKLDEILTDGDNLI
jgi:small subunit ribosomal protein S6